MVRNRISVFVGVCIVLILAACTSHRLTTIKEGVSLAPSTKFVVGKTTNESGVTVEADYQALLKGALEYELNYRKILGKLNEPGVVVLNSRMTEYDPGSALKRWALPGWGATKLAIMADLVRDDVKIGTIEARYTVNAGGLYTIGAWKDVFRDVAAIMADEAMEKVRASP